MSAVSPRIAPESNYGNAKALLFDHISIPAENIHRIRGEDFAAIEAVRFTEEMQSEIPPMKTECRLSTGYF